MTSHPGPVGARQCAASLWDAVPLLQIGIDASRATLARRTGTETYSLQLIRALIRLSADQGCDRSILSGAQRSRRTCPERSRRIHWRLYTQSSPPAGLFWDGAAPASVELRAIPFPRLWTHLRLSAEMVTRPPDVLFVPAHVLPLIHPRGSVATVHDLGYLRYPEAHRPADRRYLDWSTGWNARHAAALIADSAATKADLIQAYGADLGRVHVVHLGRDEGLARVVDPALVAEVCSRHGIGPRYVLYVGTLQPRKNLARLVDAFARLAKSPDLADLQLVLAGKHGWLYGDLLAQVARLGLQSRVLFPGYMPDPDLPALLSGAQAFAFPSLYEGFGLPVLEAGACGVPVITSNTSSLPEVAGDAALLVDPHDVDAIADAMLRLVTDDELRAELSRRGLENVKRFSWEKCARETLAVLEAVAGEGTVKRLDHEAAKGTKSAKREGREDAS